MTIFNIKHLFTIFTLFNLVLVIGCTPKEDEEIQVIEMPPGTTAIYKNTGGKQCEVSGQTVEQSAQFLISSGIDVLNSYCGTLTGLAVATVCGGQTLDINLHLIHEQNSLDATNLGYALVTDMDTANGVGYQLFECK